MSTFDVPLCKTAPHFLVSLYVLDRIYSPRLCFGKLIPTLADFGALIGAPKNTVWRWEAGQAQPDATYAERLSELAEREHFLKDWKLVGSMTLVGDLESAKAEIAELFRRSVERTASQLT